MIKIYTKPGVWFKFLSFEFLTLARIIYRIYEKQELIPTVTSACDGDHKGGQGRESLHYSGLGWDWRIWGLKDPQKVMEEIKHEAQAIDYHYDVVLEGDHIHTEYDMNKQQEKMVA